MLSLDRVVHFNVVNECVDKVLDETWSLDRNKERMSSGGLAPQEQRMDNEGGFTRNM